MTPTDALRNSLRRKLGEVIPEGGSDADTMFPAERIDELLVNNSSIEAAIIDGWEDKISEWASLVDVTDGAASRKLGDLIEHGQEVIKYYQGKLGKGPDTSLARSRTRVGKIIRRG